MKILFNDLLQASDAPGNLISPALAETWEGTGTTITLDASGTFDCVGIGYTDATAVTINGTVITIPTVSPYPDSYKDGLFVLPSQTADTIVISHDGTYIGRLAIGKSRTMYASPSREIGLWTTNAPRKTLSGQVIAGAGGVSGRQIELAFRYKFTSDIIGDIEKAWAGQISRGYPFFVIFDSESHNIPWARLYATMDNADGDSWVFQNSVRAFLHSRNVLLKEAY